MDSYRSEKNSKDNYDSHWYRMYEELRYFTEKYIDKDKYISLTSYYKDLERWVMHQRMSFKKGKLQNERIKKYVDPLPKLVC